MGYKHQTESYRTKNGEKYINYCNCFTKRQIQAVIDDLQQRDVAPDAYFVRKTGAFWRIFVKVGEV